MCEKNNLPFQININCVKCYMELSSGILASSNTTTQYAEMERELSRLTIITKDKAQVTMESLYQDLERRIVASPPGLCPVDLTRSFIKMCLDALAFQIAHHRVPACLVDAGDNHLIPGLAQYLGRFAADAAGGAFYRSIHITYPGQ